MHKLSDDIYLFHKGNNYQAYNLLAPHREKRGKKNGWVFRCFAPNAEGISIVGDFNNWQAGQDEMTRISGGIWEGFVSGLSEYDIYKFAVIQADGNTIMKSDPFALHTETPPANASKLYDISSFTWTDSKWLQRRANTDHMSAPMNIYECHIGSWRLHEDGSPYSYTELIDSLIPYVVDMGYTHIELLPIAEYPFEGSWGYQVTGMFAPTSRFGTPRDFQQFVNACHVAGIGVIADWVPAHFPKDSYGLYHFDGTYLYEYSDDMKREHREWGTVVYDYGRPEVCSFLISSAVFWLKEYHIDGLRVDAVASMLYLDYARNDGEWLPNKYGTNINLEAENFLKCMNVAVHSTVNGVLTIAEESTSYAGITADVRDGGLGFDFKWNMGWMNDTLSYLRCDPLFRQFHHEKLTFPFAYAYSEHFILPLSHDEVVHGKCSLLNKQAGSYEDQFRALKCTMGYMMTFVGKKLLFMGNELAQVIEWNYKRPLDWFLLEYPIHDDHKRFVKDLNAIYLATPALYEQDDSMAGFEWLVVDDKTQNIIIYRRIASNGDYVIAVMNFSPVERPDYRFGVPDVGRYDMLLASWDTKYGGSGVKKHSFTATADEMHGRAQSIAISIPPDSFQLLYKKGNRRTKV